MLEQIDESVKNEKKRELEQLAQEYFNSIEVEYKETEEQMKGESPAGILLMVFVLLFMFSVIPAIPILIAQNVHHILKHPIDFYIFEVPYDSKVFWWISSNAILLLIVLLLIRILKMRKERLLPYNLLPFCHIFNCIKELKAYLINQRENHLSRAKADIKNYLTRSEIKYRGGRFSTEIYNLMNSLTENYFWLWLKEDSVIMIKAYEFFDKRVVRRVFQKTELDRVITVLTDLMLYEYSKVRKISEEKLRAGEITIPDLGRISLFDFAYSVVAMSDIPKEMMAPTKKWVERVVDSFKSVYEKAFKSSNIIICILSWYVFLLVLLSVSVAIAAFMLGLVMDTTLIVGVLSAAFVGAITIASAVYSKSARK